MNMKERKKGLLLAAGMFALAMGLFAFFIMRGKEPAPAPEEPKTQGEQTSTDRSDALSRAQSENADVTGWLLLPGAEIDDPVVQAADNEYYLRRTWEREEDVWGCYFLDYECHAKTQQALDPVTIIYGHSIGDDPEGERFSRLKRYRDEVFCKENPCIILQLSDGPVQYEVFAAGEVPVSLNYLDPDPEKDVYEALLAALRGASDQAFQEVDVSAEDQVLILYT